MTAAHDAHTHAAPRLDQGKLRSLRAAFGITAGVLLLEAVGGVLTGSIALLADAGHMLTDAGALGIALAAAALGARPRTLRRTFGYGRLEILAALANGLLLGGVSVGVAIESLERLRAPHEVAAGPMIAIACLGLAANLLSALLLRRRDPEDLNLRAAYLHVLGDAAGSIAAIVAGFAILLFGLRSADALAGLGIAALLVASAFRLVREAVDVLLEGAPRHLDLEAIAQEARSIPGVRSIHDLHIWTVTSGFLAMSAHVELERGADAESVRSAVHRLLHEHYDIRHTTIQTEAPTPLLSIGLPEPEAPCRGEETPDG